MGDGQGNLISRGTCAGSADENLGNTGPHIHAQVAFLHQEDLIDAVREEVEAALLASDHTRTFLQVCLVW